MARAQPDADVSRWVASTESAGFCGGGAGPKVIGGGNSARKRRGLEILA